MATLLDVCPPLVEQSMCSNESVLSITQICVYQKNMLDVQKTTESLIERGAHMGFSRSRRHPSVGPFLFGSKHSLDVIDMESTVAQIETAITFLESVKTAGKTVLIVGSKPESREIIAKAAERNALPFVNRRWIGGTLTNWSEIRKRIERAKKLKSSLADGTAVFRTKKEKLMLERELENLEEKFGGIIHMDNLPAAIIVIDPRSEYICVLEAVGKKIPVVAIANTDCNIANVDYPIVANDANMQSVSYILQLLLDTQS